MRKQIWDLTHAHNFVLVEYDLSETHYVIWIFLWAPSFFSTPKIADHTIRKLKFATLLLRFLR